MRIKLILPVVISLLLLAPKPAAAADVNPLFVGLGLLKTPGIAFDIVGAAFIGPQRGVFEDGTRMHRATRAAFTSHLVSLGLHTVSIGAFMVGAFGDWEEATGPVFLINAVSDISIGVMGLITGIDILLAKSTVDIQGSVQAISATWSGILNISMGTFGILWFAPMTIGGMIGIADLAVRAPPADSHIAMRLRGPSLRAAVIPSAGGLTVLGTF